MVVATVEVVTVGVVREEVGWRRGAGGGDGGGGDGGGGDGGGGQGVVMAVGEGGGGDGGEETGVVKVVAVKVVEVPAAG